VDLPLLAAGVRLSARPVAWDALQDIAVLTLEGELPAGIQPPPLVAVEDGWGDNLRVFGFPPGYSHGVWAPARLRGRNAVGWVQIDNTEPTGYLVSPGFSGTPVWDAALGGVIGMVVAADARTGIKAAYMIPAQTLCSTLGIQHSAISNPQSEIQSPFFVGGRVNDPDLFFGRQQLLREMRSELRKFCSISLVGETQMGKSSLLYYLYKTQSEWLEGAQAEYLDLQSVWNETDFCALLLEKLGLPGDTPRELRKALAGRAIILLLDELEQLADTDFSPKLHGMLRAFAQEQNFAMCVATRRRLEEIFPPSGMTSPFHNIFTIKALGPFSVEECREFLAQRLSVSRVRFTPEEVDRLVRESQGYPGKLQRMAKELFEEHIR
jgi:hypothetical protein